MEPASLLLAAAVGAVYGVVFALYGVITKKDPDEPVKVKKAARTTLLFAAAGVIVSTQGGQLTQSNIAQHVTEVGFIGVVFDMAWSRLRRSGYLDGILGERE